MKLLQVLRKYRRQLQILFSLRKTILSIVIIAVILALLTLIALIIFWLYVNNKNYVFEISMNGFNTFFNIILLSYKDLLTLIFSIFGIYLVVIQVKEMSLTNIIALRTQWKKELYKELENIKERNSYMVDHFKLRSDDIYEFLYNFDQRINDRETLELFYNKFIKNNIIDFEKYALENVTFNFQYTNNQIPFSLMHFRRISSKLLNPHYNYSDFNADFDDLYKKDFLKIKNVLCQ